MSWAVRQGRDARGARGGGELQHGRVGRVSLGRALALTRQAETAPRTVWKGSGKVVDLWSCGKVVKRLLKGSLPLSIMERCGAEVRGGLRRGGPLDGSGEVFLAGREALDLLGGAAMSWDELASELGQTATVRRASPGGLGRRSERAPSKVAKYYRLWMPLVSVAVVTLMVGLGEAICRGFGLDETVRPTSSSTLSTLTMNSGWISWWKTRFSCGVRSETTGTDSSGSTRKDSGKTGTTASRSRRGSFGSCVWVIPRRFR